MSPPVLHDAVAVLATERDLTVDHVVTELAERGVPTARVDTADFPQHLTLTARLGESGWGGALTGEYREVDLGSLRSVYYRRPGQFQLAEGMSTPERGWAYREARMGFGGALLGLGCLWVNDPRIVAGAEYKPTQLAIAQRCGLAVPDTLVTNDPVEAQRWASRLDGPVVYKPLGGVRHVEEGTSTVVFTTTVEVEELADPALALTAHCLQAWVDKDHEARVTIVGDHMFAVAIHADSSPAHQDWRRDYTTHRYTTVDVPSDIRVGLRRYMATWGLSYGAADFVITPEGEWVLLEVNPNGEWGWLAYHCDLPIAATLADLLEKGATS
ncbi:ATP-grasp ribosomal peptide maturase [Halostreptopolyspora alba]|uniref:ATP-grasp ribosomal peptide maturase n=1 Tax=Halostreptopolyspora alba TaxID=2487137 RepID=A0A3N0E810_9ACTN|nr:ATP-grasp ribosomal peptide maturase [Nocardiopsaceae bacterium YIM 96095]